MLNLNRSIACILIAFVLSSTSAYAVPQDKQLHLGAGCAVALVTNLAMSDDYSPNQKFVISVAAATGVGLAKELYDRRHKGHTYDTRDAIATSLGGAVCATFSYKF